MRNSSLPLITILVCALFGQVSARSSGTLASTEKLLSRIDLSAKGMEKVKEASVQPEQASRELLNYYRFRTIVKHPVDRKLKAQSLGNCASTDEIRTADNAMKHIFVGQSAYPPYFCGDDINWGTRPVPDNEWVWQLNRMNFWNDMASAYWHTGDEKYAREWCAQLLDWTVKNPNVKEHSYAWRSIETGIRGNRWTALFQYFLDSPHFTPEVLVAFLNSCYVHAEFLMTQYRSKSNWGLMEAEGMAFLAITFPEMKDSEKWLKEAVRRLNNEIDLQVYPDGQQRELAMGYHLGSIDWFIRTYDLAIMNGKTDFFPATYVEKVQKMCEVPMKLCHPDGTTAQFGDAWAGRPGQHARKFQAWADRFNRQDFLFLASAGQKGKRPDSTAYALPYSGLYSMRSSWERDAICLVLKCGPDGGGHSQPDNGTFELSAGGRTLMPDGGSYIYSGDPVNRNWFRQTKVHQTVTLDGQNSKYAPRQLLWKPGKKDDIMVVENKSYDNLAHRRAVFFVDKRYFVIVDEAIGSAAGEVDLHFQLAPGKAKMDFAAMQATSDFSEGWNVMVETTPQKGLTMEAEEGQVSFLYTKKEPRPAFRYRMSKTDSQPSLRFITLVIPFKDKSPKISVTVVGKAEIGGSELQLEINEKGQKKLIGYSL